MCVCMKLFLRDLNSNHSFQPHKHLILINILIVIKKLELKKKIIQTNKLKKSNKKVERKNQHQTEFGISFSKKKKRLWNNTVIFNISKFLWVWLVYILRAYINYLF